MTGNRNIHISVECVLFSYDLKQLKVLLLSRKFINNTDDNIKSVDFMLIGETVFKHESLEEAACRIVYKNTGLKDIYLRQFGAYALPEGNISQRDRLWRQLAGIDPDTRVVSVSYLVLVKYDDMKTILPGRDLSWHSVDLLPEMAFNHGEITRLARKFLCDQIRLGPVAFNLLPKKFSLSQLQSFYELIFAVNYDKRNFRKKVTKSKYLIPLGEKESHVPHKPANLYMFSFEVYELTRKESVEFPV